MRISRRWAAACCLLALGASVLPAVAGTPDVRLLADADQPAARPFLDADPEPLAPTGQAPGRRVAWGLIGSGAGLVAGVGLALWIKSEADDRYDAYLRTADPEAARELFDSAQRYDRASLIGWGMAEVSLVALMYFLTREGKRPLIPVEGEPVLRTRDGSVQLGFQVTP